MWARFAAVVDRIRDWLKTRSPSQGLSVFLMSLRAQRGNLVAVAMMVPRHVLNLNEIATSLRSSQ